MDNIDRSLSIKLYDVMDQVGVSERIRKLYQDTAVINEIIWTIFYQIYEKPKTDYIFGSSCEGTTTEGLDSDIDVVNCNEYSLVIDEIIDAPIGDSFLMVRDNHTYPGYVKLQHVKDGTPMTIYNTGNFCHHYDTDTEGRKCRKHVSRIDLTDNLKERHGPADASKGCEHVKPQDYVFALRCRTIPLCARMWLHRRRRQNWPSRENLQKMGDLGCFVVGVGHSSSRERTIEWRLSFSLQERLLMFSLNPTQHKCYVLLKLIKKDIIKAEIGECISSYHCKTCLFHAIEVTQAAIWRPDNLICCVRLCLVILLTWVVNGVCPNYFIPSENMFEKPQFRANRYRLLELLRALTADENSIMLRIRCDDIRHRILQSGILYRNMTDNIVHRRYTYLYSNIIRFSMVMFRLGDVMYTLDNDSQIIHQIQTFSSHIERLAITPVIGEHTEQHTRDAISYVVPVLHLHIAQRLASLICKGHNQEHARLLLPLTIHQFQLGNNTDLMTSRLLLVSLLLRLEKYDLCEIILEGIEHDLKRYVVSKCYCFDRPYAKNAHLLQYLSANNVSCKTAMRTVYVGCVKFARCDTEITPQPLHYEMYRSIGTVPGSRDDGLDDWFDWAVVDGQVYLYFLQYLVYSRLNKIAKKQVAAENLYWAIGDKNLGHTETACNLLGWICIQEALTADALHWFRASWIKRPDHNAAKFHLLNMYTN